ncbi:MAG TPA: NAD(P)H-nitrite reductase, partial [Leeuwenhoekiella sp.]|nr:NAD(P)H-nitrite reductase [Leeuwenhoekiella sp.]
KKAVFNIPSTLYNRSIKPDAEYPFVLTTGRVRDQWHTMTKTGKVSRLKTHYPTPVLEIHPVDAVKLKIREGTICEVASENGNVRVKAKLTDTIRQGVVFLPMHWGKKLASDLNRTNNLTQNMVDPQSKEPDFKFTAVRVEKYTKKREKIVVIGSGAAAFRFIQNYRERNTQDIICVFSKEAHPFYNRVLLPEYITEELSWEQLLKIKEQHLSTLDIRLFKNNSIVDIDKKSRTLKDSQGIYHAYDKLIVATGSRAFVPTDVRLDLPGRFTMRDKLDADRFKKYLMQSGIPNDQQHVVIVGGGLLGLELAAALRHKSVKITIIQRS